MSYSNFERRSAQRKAEFERFQRWVLAWGAVVFVVLVGLAIFAILRFS